MRAEKRYALEQNRAFNACRTNDDRKAARENNRQADALSRRVPFSEYLNIMAAFEAALREGAGRNDAQFPRLNPWRKSEVGRAAIAARAERMEAGRRLVESLAFGRQPEVST